MSVNKGLEQLGSNDIIETHIRRRQDLIASINNFVSCVGKIKKDHMTQSDSDTLLHILPILTEAVNVLLFKMGKGEDPRLLRENK